jgi:hypothetical protein
MDCGLFKPALLLIPLLPQFQRLITSPNFAFRRCVKISATSGVRERWPLTPDPP